MGDLRQRGVGILGGDHDRFFWLKINCGGLGNRTETLDPSSTLVFLDHQ